MDLKKWSIVFLCHFLFMDTSRGQEQSSSRLFLGQTIEKWSAEGGAHQGDILETRLPTPDNWGIYVGDFSCVANQANIVGGLIRIHIRGIDPSSITPSARIGGDPGPKICIGHRLAASDVPGCGNSGFACINDRNNPSVKAEIYPLGSILENVAKSIIQNRDKAVEMDTRYEQRFKETEVFKEKTLTALQDGLRKVSLDILGPQVQNGLLDAAKVHLDQAVQTKLGDVNREIEALKAEIAALKRERPTAAARRPR